MSACKYPPGPSWRVEFCMPLTRHAGLYVSRMRTDLPTPNAKEWLLRDGKPARFTSRKAADAAIAKAGEAA